LKKRPTVLARVALEATSILLDYTSTKFTALLDVWRFDELLPLLGFLRILYQTRFFRSTDPKDKLYGIIGLVSFEDFPIKPHYEWSRQQVYTNLFRTLLETLKKLQILSLSGISTERQHTCTLPSWMPHLDCGMSAAGVPFQGYKASGDSMAKAYISQSSLSLFAKGLLHRSVHLVHFFSSLSYLEDLDECISFLPNASSYSPGVRALEDIEVCLKLSRGFIKWRCLTGDTVLLVLVFLLPQKDPTERSSFHLICGYLGVLVAIVRKSRSQSFGEKLFESGVMELLHLRLGDAFWGSREQPSVVTEELALAGNVPLFLEAISQASSNAQCFFITHNEYIGIGPRAIRPDDKIFILFGCDVPLVIRSMGKEFVVIGSCLIYGLMKGEIMEELKRGDIEPKELEFI
jgi:hypothetical protein